MTTPSDSSSTSLSQLAERRLLVCTACRGPLAWQADPNWLASLHAGKNVESPATRPAGASATSPSAAALLSVSRLSPRLPGLGWHSQYARPEAARLTAAS